MKNNNLSLKLIILSVFFFYGCLPSEQANTRGGSKKASSGTLKYSPAKAQSSSKDLSSGSTYAQEVRGSSSTVSVSTNSKMDSGSSDHFTTDDQMDEATFIGDSAEDLFESGRTQLHLDGENIVFDSELGSILEGISKSDMVRQDKKIQKSPKCSKLWTLLNKVRDSKCSKTSSVHKKIKKAIDSCQLFYSPLDRFTLHKIQPQTKKNVADSVEKMLYLWASAIAQTEISSHFKSKKFRVAAKNIVQKVFINDTEKKIKEAQSLLDSITSVNQSNCSLSGYDLSLAQANMEDAQSELDDYREENKRITKATELNSENSRKELPFPLLTDNERRALAVFLSAGAWRNRGAGFYKKIVGTSYLRREFIKIAFQKIAELLGGSNSSGIGNALYMRIFKSWGDFYDMGRWGGDKHEDLVLMRERGDYQAKSLLSTLDNLGYETNNWNDFGEQFGNCYYYSWEKYFGKLNWGMNAVYPLVSIASGGTSWGELCVGSLLGLKLSNSLLPGYNPDTRDKIGYKKIGVYAKVITDMSIDKAKVGIEKTTKVVKKTKKKTVTKVKKAKKKTVTKVKKAKKKVKKIKKWWKKLF